MSLNGHCLIQIDHGEGVFFLGNEGKDTEDMQQAMIFQDELAAQIRAKDGNLCYEYFFPMEDKETVLLIDSWKIMAAVVRGQAPVGLSLGRPNYFGKKENAILHMTVDICEETMRATSELLEQLKLPEGFAHNTDMLWKITDLMNTAILGIVVLRHREDFNAYKGALKSAALAMINGDERK